MKTLITIIIIILIGLGIWWAQRGPDVDNGADNSAAVGNVDIFGNDSIDNGTSTPDGLEDDEIIEEKG